MSMTDWQPRPAKIAALFYKQKKKDPATFAGSVMMMPKRVAEDGVVSVRVHYRLAVKKWQMKRP